MPNLDLEALKADYEKARQTISDLCHQRKRWIMSIPARPDYDPDLLIGAAIGHGKTLIDEVERLRWELAKAKRIGAAEWHEQEARKYTPSMGMCERAYHLKIAAELRKESE